MRLCVTMKFRRQCSARWLHEEEHEDAVDRVGPQSRIEEEIRGSRSVAPRRSSKTVPRQDGGVAVRRKPPVRAIAPTLLEEDVIESARPCPPVRSVPPVAFRDPAPCRRPRTRHRRRPSTPHPRTRSTRGRLLGAAAVILRPAAAIYSAPPPRLVRPAVIASVASSVVDAPVDAPSSMAPASLFPHSTPNYIVWPEAPEPTLRAAMDAAAPRRGNALLMAVATSRSRSRALRSRRPRVTSRPRRARLR